jgi:hypothetical protein
VDDAVAGFGVFGARGRADVLVVFACIRRVQAIEDEAEVFVRVLLAVARQVAAAFPAPLQHVYGAVAFVLLLPVELGEDVVKRARGAGFALALGAAVAFAEVVGAHEGVVDQRL